MISFISLLFLSSFFYFNRLIPEILLVCETCWFKPTYRFWRRSTREIMFPFSKSLEYATFSIKNYYYEKFILKQFFLFILWIAREQKRIVVQFELLPWYIGAVQKCFTNKLSSPRPHNNNFFNTECFVFPFLQRLKFSGSTDNVRNSFT